MGPKKNPPRSKTDEEQERTPRADRSTAENTPRRSTRSAAQIATVKLSSRNRPSRSNEITSKAAPSKSVADAGRLIKPNDSESNHNLGEIQAQTDRNGVDNGQYPSPNYTSPDFDVGPGFVPTSVCNYIRRSARDRIREYVAPSPDIENIVSPIHSPQKGNSSSVGPLLLPSTDEDIEESVKSILNLEHSPELDSAYEENSSLLPSDPVSLRDSSSNESNLPSDPLSLSDPSSDESKSSPQGRIENNDGPYSVSSPQVGGRTNAFTQCSLTVIETADASTCTREDGLLSSSENESSSTSEEESRGNETGSESESNSSTERSSEGNGTASGEESATSEENTEIDDPEENPLRDRGLILHIPRSVYDSILTGASSVIENIENTDGSTDPPDEDE